MTVRIRRLHAAEAAAISALALRSKAHWGYPQAFMLACREEFTYRPTDIDAQPFYGVDSAPEPVSGFYALASLSAQQCELEALFVEPHRIGQGYGRALMAHAVATAAALGHSVMLIQADPHATTFYLAAGARRVGERESGSVPGRMLPLFTLDLPA